MPVNNLVQIDPQFVPFELWANQQCINNPSFPLPSNEVNWKDWAAQVCSTDGNAPNPTSYSSWRLWAVDWMRSQ